MCVCVVGAGGGVDRHYVWGSTCSADCKEVTKIISYRNKLFENSSQFYPYLCSTVLLKLKNYDKVSDMNILVDS